MNETSSFHGRATIKGVIFLFIYYIVILGLGLCISLTTLFININPKINYYSFIYNNYDLSQGINIYTLALIGSIGTSLLGNAVYYLRKLYKFSLGKKFIITINSDEDKIENLGTIFYFTLRPLFSVSFTILLILGLKSGMFVLTGSSDQLKPTLVDILMFINYFIGFSTGKFIKSLEDKSEKVINSVFKEKA